MFFYVDKSGKILVAFSAEREFLRASSQLLLQTNGISPGHAAGNLTHNSARNDKLVCRQDCKTHFTFS